MSGSPAGPEACRDEQGLVLMPEGTGSQTVDPGVSKSGGARHGRRLDDTRNGDFAEKVRSLIAGPLSLGRHHHRTMVYSRMFGV
jgi:hypothetical protein